MPTSPTTSAPKGTVYYISLNQKNQNLAKPEVREAFKYLVDYDAIGETLIKGIGEIHQNFLPKGVLGALDDNPYKLDVAKAKELLAKAGLPDGFSVTMDVRNTQPVTGIAESIQQTAGAGRHQDRDHPRRRQADADQVPRPQPRHVYRPVGRRLLGSELQRRDLHHQSRTMPTIRTNKTLAWRNAWDVPETDGKDQGGAARAGQRQARRDVQGAAEDGAARPGPFVMIFQQTEVAGLRGNVKGFKLGPTFDTNFVGAGHARN